TRGIKNCRDSRLFKGCSPLQLLCNLTGNHPQSATFHTATVTCHFEQRYMRKLTYLLLLILISRFVFSQADNDQIIFNRIEYVYYLKSLVDKDIWRDFSNKRYDVPLVYYTDLYCYTVNPTTKFMETFKPNHIYSANDFDVYKSALIDSAPFHLSTSILLGDTTPDFNYMSPYLLCSSFEIANKIIPDLTSTEEWAAMVIHEYFHGFQFMHNNYLDLFEREALRFPSDRLKCLYKNNSWFKVHVDKENELLLLAIKSDSKIETIKYIDSFFEIRDKRRLATVDSFGFDIKDPEQIYETMEGTARYVEKGIYDKLANERYDPVLSQTDTSYHSNKKFKEFNIENEPWLFQTSETTYFYATGFNIARLLDKLEIEYKSRLFKDNDHSLESILKNGR
ncbi:MAG: hypothetical protein JXB49_30675, partial [Bacteroidales bacterium]|nr:hypothetical protein [Bacteroidales bacterium]